MNDFEEFVAKYSKKHEITPEEAKTHYLVKEVQAYYEERDKGVENEQTFGYISSPQKTGSEEETILQIY